jgi:hypothetical protein
VKQLRPSPGGGGWFRVSAANEETGGVRAQSRQPHPAASLRSIADAEHRRSSMQERRPEAASAPSPCGGGMRHPVLTAPARIFPPGRIVRIAPRVKYSPDQPRVPAGHSDGGQWTNGDGRDGGGSDAEFSPSRPGWHDYPSGPNLVCRGELRCSHEEIADQLARFSLPGGDPSRPVADGNEYPVYLPGTDLYAGDIRVAISDEGLTITNRTLPGHIFFDGVVVRSARQDSAGAWHVTTRGFGNNVEPGINLANQLVGPEIFNHLDREMRANIERHHAKGLRALAVHRMDGSGRHGGPASFPGNRGAFHGR